MNPAIDPHQHRFVSADTLDQAQAEAALSTEAPAGAYEGVWAQTEVPTAEPLGLERYMVQQDKLYVVLAVVLIIWFGLLLLLFRTDRRLARVERDLESGEPT
jgi:hypothetical protein